MSLPDHELLELNALCNALDQLRGDRERRAMRLVRQNIAWAIVYNFASIPFAAAGLVPAWLAAIGMSASSLLVVANALRLRNDPQAA